MTKDQHDKKIIEAIISRNISESTKTDLTRIKGDYILDVEKLSNAIDEMQPGRLIFFQRKDIKEDLKNQLNKLYEEIQLNRDKNKEVCSLASDEDYSSKDYFRLNRK